MIRRISLVAGSLVLATSTHAANKDIELLRSQITYLQARVEENKGLAEEAAREMKRLNEVLADQNASLKKGLADQKAQNEALAATLKDILDQIGELKENAVPLPPVGSMPANPATAAAFPPSSASAPGAVPGTAQAPPAATSPTAPGAYASVPAPRELYSQAYADYARGNYDLAVAAFQEYIRSYPGTDFTDNAQYWIGECLYGKKLFTEAVEAWNVLFRDYPASDKLPDARVKKGMALEKLGRRSQALVEYRFVIDKFPNSPAARIAREKMIQ